MNLRLYPGISVPIAVDYTGEGPTEGVDDQGAITASVPMFFRWEDREELYRSLKGGWRKRNGILYYEASTHRHWEYPSISVTSIGGVKGVAPRGAVDPGNPLRRYEFGRLTAEYNGTTGADGNDQAEDRLDPARSETVYEMEINQSAKIVTIKEGLLEMVDPPMPGSGTAKPFNGEMGVLSVEAELNLRFPRIARAQPAVFRPYLGRVNSAPMLGYDAGQVMFAGVSTSLSFATDGERRVSISLSFLAQDRDWNVIIGETGAPKLVRFKASSPTRYPFEYKDLTQVFSGAA